MRCPIRIDGHRACTSDAFTSTTGTGVPIYWLGGSKVANDYPDFYDGHWQNEGQARTVQGVRTYTYPYTASTRPWTGCEFDGMLDPVGPLGGDDMGRVVVGKPNSSGLIDSPLSSDQFGTNTQRRPLYGLSQVFQVNRPATGRPTISGTPTVNQTLTADTSGIADPDGLASPSWRYQWIRVDGRSERDISGATGSTYTLTNADLDKRIKVRVSFTDDIGYSERRTSNVFPPHGTLGATAYSPTGQPTIRGRPVVGQTLIVLTGGIADRNGLSSPNQLNHLTPVLRRIWGS